MKNLKNKNGITLIALVITIIVLVILAGISIAIMSGENGILTKAIVSKENTIVGEDKEKINLVLSEYEVLKHTANLPMIEELFESKEWCENATLNGDIIKVEMKNGNEYDVEVNDNLNTKEDMYELQASTRPDYGENWVFALYNKITGNYEMFGERLVAENLDDGIVEFDGNANEYVILNDEFYSDIVGYPAGKTYVLNISSICVNYGNYRITVYKNGIGYIWEGFINVPK